MLSIEEIKLLIEKLEKVKKEDLQELIDSNLKILKDLGAQLIDISLPHTKYALPTYYIVAPAEASSNLARYDGVRYGYRSKIGKDSIEM